MRECGGTMENGCTQVVRAGLEIRFIRYAEQEAYLAAGWTITPHIGPHAAYGIIASRAVCGD